MKPPVRNAVNEPMGNPKKKKKESNLELKQAITESLAFDVFVMSVGFVSLYRFAER